ncbi:hypothetical protein WJX81_005260 [Elliptochloris bilobata]|uniref:Uncharacterized protein n=1 Tax=Elliptochloris bilobata TaxID=381761 RepID=A0AAW1RV99_9CHLO
MLAGCGDGEEELVMSMFSEKPAETKLLLTLLTFGVTLGGSIGVCALTGEAGDFFGGASWSWETAAAAAVGALASGPLVALYAAMWMPSARAAFPAVDSRQNGVAGTLRPILNNLSWAQAAAVCVLDVSSTVALQLPALQGALAKSFGLYATFLQDKGVPVPAGVPEAAALASTAALWGAAFYAYYAATAEEVEVVDTAVANADRYYRLVAMGMASRSGDAEWEAALFKAAAAQWLSEKKANSSLNALLQIFEVVFLGMLWRATGNLAAPLTAALLANAVDFACVYRSMPRTEDSQH